VWYAGRILWRVSGRNVPTAAPLSWKRSSTDFARGDRRIGKTSGTTRALDSVTYKERPIQDATTIQVFFIRYEKLLFADYENVVSVSFRTKGSLR